MMQINMKRCLSLILALALTFSMLPVSVLAEEEGTQSIVAETTVPTEVTEAPTEALEETTVPEATVPVVVTVVETAPMLAATESTALQTVQETMTDIMEYYLGSAALTAEEAVALVAELDPYDTAAANMEIYELEISEEFLSLTEEELLVVDSNQVFWAFADAIYQKAAVEGAISTYGVQEPDTNGETGTVLDGKVSIAPKWYEYTSISLSYGSVVYKGNTVTLKSINNSRYTQYKSSVTITNKSGAKAVLSLTYAATNYSAFDVFSQTADSGSYSVTLDNNASCTLSITGPAQRSGEATLTLNFVSISPVDKTYDVTVEYDSAKGSVSVDGVASPSGYTKQGVSASAGVLLEATEKNSKFLGWINKATNERLSTDSSFTLMPAANCTVVPVFASAESDAWFLVDEKYLTDDLTTATTLGSKIVLAHDGTLPSGSYTIPSGDTLLIPFDSAHTLYTNSPELVTDNAAIVTPTAFRTLTMADGAHITVNGVMSLSGKVHAYMGIRYQNSAPTGPSGRISMNENSSITVGSNGTLYAWGYIVGSGEVVVNSSGTVYECFQVRDWRGGDATSSMKDNSNRVFPVSQYYVQNIEVPLTLKYGATEKGFLATYVQKMKKTAEFTFIGSDGMFRLSDANSSVTKRYDGTTDRLVVDINGNLSVSSLVISIDTGIIGSVTLNSANYTLPLNGNITVNVLSGSNVTIAQDLAMLPGAILNIENGADMTLASGTKVFIYDQDEWGGYCVPSVEFRSVCWAYSKTYTRSASDLVDAKILVNGTVDASAGYVYTTNGGANICSTGNGVVKLATGTQAVTYQATQADTNITYVEIPITPAKLKHGDGTYLATGDADQGSGTYYYHPTHQKWVKGEHVTAKDVVTAPTCTEQGYTTHTCTCGYEYKDTYTAALGHTEAIDAAVAPTCTASGKTEGKHCSVCNEVLVAQEEVAALGHSYSDWQTTPATLDAAAVKTRTCACGERETQTLMSASTNGTEYLTLKEALTAAADSAIVTLLTNFDSTKITITQNVTINKDGYTAEIAAGTGYYIKEETETMVTIQKRIIAGTSVRAGDCLDIYFYIDGLEGNDYEARITRVEDGVTKTEDPIPASEWQASGDYRRFAYTGIAAKEMTDTVTVIIYDKAGNLVSETATESIEAYALRTLEKRSGKELQTALVDMLNYGADAQTHFGHNTSNLANANLSDEEKEFATEADATLTQSMTGTTTGNVTFAGASVTAGTTLYLNFFFKGITEADKSDYRAVLTYTDHYGTDKECKISGSAFVNTTTSDGIAVFGPQLTGLAAADGRQPVSCTIYKGEEQIAVANASVEGYVNTTIGKSDNTTLIAVCKSLMKFVDSANAYFRSLEP